MVQVYTEAMRKARIARVSLWRKLLNRVQYRSIYPVVEPYDRGALKVSSLLFMLSGRELEWFYRYGGASTILPEAWNDSLEVVLSGVQARSCGLHTLFAKNAGLIIAYPYSNIAGASET